MENIALVVGSTGITGSNLADELIANNWMTYGLARNHRTPVEGLEPVTADLLDTESVEQALKDISPTQVFFTTWMRKETEEENIRTNGTMVKTFSTPCLSKNRCATWHWLPG